MRRIRGPIFFVQRGRTAAFAGVTTLHCLFRDPDERSDCKCRQYADLSRRGDIAGYCAFLQAASCWARLWSWTFHWSGPTLAHQAMCALRSGLHSGPEKPHFSASFSFCC
jgi:hypothetical protein